MIPLRRQLVSGPEVARLLDEFAFCDEGTVHVTLEHHDSTIATQSQLLKDVNSLVLTINDLGNPFTDDSSDLYVIDTKDVKGKDVAKSITVIEDIGTQQFRTYYDQRLSTT